MKVPLWCLVVLLVCLFTPGRSDCQGQCAACGLLLQQQQKQQLQQAFNVMVCLLECEGHVSSSLTWELCKRAVKLTQHHLIPEGDALFKRTGEELDLASLGLNSDDELPQEDDQDDTPVEQRSVHYDSSLLDSSEDKDGLQDLDFSLLDDEMKLREERSMESDGQLEEGEGDSSEAVILSKRFGGFQRGRHSYRKLIGSPMRAPRRGHGGVSKILPYALSCMCG
ncbi:prepronociceptin b [Cynoglossus semilaevis]|uniref:prepronociceptin b n=1 Tax=Cynoglossus semilaevis TaxID=244447 RepID=UPI000495F97F|nr:proenkephalin-A-like [Cynoglossus semilaevis]